jgi:hypothetical protein
MPKGIYIRDYNNGIYTAVGGTKVTIEALTGPFDNNAAAVDYLTHSYAHKVGSQVSLIEWYQPDPDWTSSGYGRPNPRITRTAKEAKAKNND